MAYAQGDDQGTVFYFDSKKGSIDPQQLDAQRTCPDCGSDLKIGDIVDTRFMVQGRDDDQYSDNEGFLSGSIHVRTCEPCHYLVCRVETFAYQGY